MPTYDAHSQHAHDLRDADVEHVVATLRTHGALTRARLAELAGAGDLCGPEFTQALALAVSTGKVRPLNGELYEISDTTRRYEMPHPVYPATTSDLATHRAELAPETHDAFQAFSRQVFAEGALPEKTKQLIAVAAAHVTQCPYCIRSHTRIAMRKGATEQEIMEAIWVAAEMRAGGAYAHSVIALDAAGEGSDGRQP